MERLYTSWIDFQLCDVNNFSQLNQSSYTTVSELEQRYFSFFDPMRKTTTKRAQTACRKRDIPARPGMLAHLFIIRIST